MKALNQILKQTKNLESCFFSYMYYSLPSHFQINYIFTIMNFIVKIIVIVLLNWKILIDSSGHQEGIAKKFILTLYNLDTTFISVLVITLFVLKFLFQIIFFLYCNNIANNKTDDNRFLKYLVQYVSSLSILGFQWLPLLLIFHYTYFSVFVNKVIIAVLLIIFLILITESFLILNFTIYLCRKTAELENRNYMTSEILSQVSCICLFTLLFINSQLIMFFLMIFVLAVEVVSLCKISFKQITIKTFTKTILLMLYTVMIGSIMDISQYEFVLVLLTSITLLTFILIRNLKINKFKKIWRVDIKDYKKENVMWIIENWEKMFYYRVDYYYEDVNTSFNDIFFFEMLLFTHRKYCNKPNCECNRCGNNPKISFLYKIRFDLIIGLIDSVNLIKFDEELLMKKIQLMIWRMENFTFPLFSVENIRNENSGLNTRFAIFSYIKYINYRWTRVKNQSELTNTSNIEMMKFVNYTLSIKMFKKAANDLVTSMYDLIYCIYQNKSEIKDVEQNNLRYFKAKKKYLSIVERSDNKYLNTIHNKIKRFFIPELSESFSLKTNLEEPVPVNCFNYTPKTSFIISNLSSKSFGTIVYFNENFIKLTKMTKSQLLDSNIDILLPKTCIDSHNKAIKNYIDSSIEKFGQKHNNVYFVNSLYKGVAINIFNKNYVNFQNSSFCVFSGISKRKNEDPFLIVEKTGQILIISKSFMQNVKWYDSNNGKVLYIQDLIPICAIYLNYYLNIEKREINELKDKIMQGQIFIELESVTSKKKVNSKIIERINENISKINKNEIIEIEIKKVERLLLENKFPILKYKVIFNFESISIGSQSLILIRFLKINLYTVRYSFSINKISLMLYRVVLFKLFIRRIFKRKPVELYNGLFKFKMVINRKTNQSTLITKKYQSAKIKEEAKNASKWNDKTKITIDNLQSSVETQMRLLKGIILLLLIVVLIYLFIFYIIISVYRSSIVYSSKDTYRNLQRNNSVIQLMNIYPLYNKVDDSVSTFGRINFKNEFMSSLSMDNKGYLLDCFTLSYQRLNESLSSSPYLEKPEISNGPYLFNFWINSPDKFDVISDLDFISIYNYLNLQPLTNANLNLINRISLQYISQIKPMSDFDNTRNIIDNLMLYGQVCIYLFTGLLIVLGLVIIYKLMRNFKSLQACYFFAFSINYKGDDFNFVNQLIYSCDLNTACDFNNLKRNDNINSSQKPKVSNYSSYLLKILPFIFLIVLIIVFIFVFNNYLFSSFKSNYDTSQNFSLSFLNFENALNKAVFSSFNKSSKRLITSEDFKSIIYDQMNRVISSYLIDYQIFDAEFCSLVPVTKKTSCYNITNNLGKQTYQYVVNYLTNVLSSNLNNSEQWPFNSSVFLNQYMTYVLLILANDQINQIHITKVNENTNNVNTITTIILVVLCVLIILSNVVIIFLFKYQFIKKWEEALPLLMHISVDTMKTNSRLQQFFKGELH